MLVRKDLPQIRGQYKFNFNLGKTAYFRTGGHANIVFIPSDIDDLRNFIINKPADLKTLVLGNLSNVLVLESGLRECVIFLKNLNKIEVCENNIFAEAGALLCNVIKTAATKNIACCENLYMIPGTVGGALAMNAGVPEFEICDALTELTYINDRGELITTSNFNMKYRDGNLNGIAVSCVLRGRPDINISAELAKIFQKRIKTQPITAATCGCTFKNPKGQKAWQLISSAGCLELKVGGAHLSPLHCNFIINDGTATPSDILALIDLVKARVFDATGVILEEEVKILGERR